MSDVYDEATETYEDTYEQPDKDETMPELRQEETSEKPIHKRTTMPKQKVQVQKQSKYRNKSEVDNILMKNDTIRKKYDVRYIDEKKINNIFMRAHIKQLKDRSKPDATIKPIDSTTDA